MSNSGCKNCHWYDSCGGWANWCLHPENKRYCSTAIKDFTLHGDAFELNSSRDCNKFKQIKGWRKFLRG